MRIVHVVTLVTPEGAYGGPVRVALNQARALIDAGHDVVVAATHRGYGEDVPGSLDGVPVRLFPAKTLVPGIGFAGLSSPSLQTWLSSEMARIDVLHVHLARDFVTLFAARTAITRSTPLVVQPHGMLDVSKRVLAIPLDAALTKPVLRRAKCVFFLTDQEERDLAELAGPKLALKRLHNGVGRAVPSERSSTKSDVDVLFVARLHARKRPVIFVEMARILSAKFPRASFSLVGPDEGEGHAVERAIQSAGYSGRIRWEGPLSMVETPRRTRESDIFVLPSIHEPFPMAVLEAMAAGLPVVVTDTCGIAPVIRERDAGIVVNDSLENLVEAVERLLADGELRTSMGARARATADELFGMASVESILSREYRRASATVSAS